MRQHGAARSPPWGRIVSRRSNLPTRLPAQKRSCQLRPWLRAAMCMLIVAMLINGIFSQYIDRPRLHESTLLFATESWLVAGLVAGAFVVMMASGVISMSAYCLRALCRRDRSAVALPASSRLVDKQRRAALTETDVPSAPAGWGGGEQRWRYESIQARQVNADVLDRRLGMCVWWTPASTRRTTTLSRPTLPRFASRNAIGRRRGFVHQPQSQPSAIAILNSRHAGERHHDIPWQARRRICAVGKYALPFPIPLVALPFFGVGMLLTHAISLFFGLPGVALTLAGGTAAAVAGCVLLRACSDRRWRTINVPARDPVAAGRVATLARAHALASRLTTLSDASPDFALALHAVRWLTWEIAGLQHHDGSYDALTGLYGKAGALRDRLAALDAEHQRNAPAAPANACAQAARAQALEHAQSASEMASLVLHDLRRLKPKSRSDQSL